MLEVPAVAITIQLSHSNPLWSQDQERALAVVSLELVRAGMQFANRLFGCRHANSDGTMGGMEHGKIEGTCTAYPRRWTTQILTSAAAGERQGVAHANGR